MPKDPEDKNKNSPLKDRLQFLIQQSEAGKNIVCYQFMKDTNIFDFELDVVSSILDRLPDHIVFLFHISVGDDTAKKVIDNIEISIKRNNRCEATIDVFMGLSDDYMIPNKELVS